MQTTAETGDFDSYAAEYDDALNRGLSVSGEDKMYFARRRLAWLASLLPDYAPERPASVLDYGCGTGDSTPLFYELLGARRVTGIDVSCKSLEIARRNMNGWSAEFLTPDQHAPDGTIDVAFCNGVFHHVQPAERPDAVKYIVRCLRPGGLFAFWENNPWNPGTRYVMSRIPFDRDAQTLTARTARRLLTSAGLRVLRTDYCFIFPRLLRGLRVIEPWMRSIPAGAQYQVLCRKT